MPCAFLSLEQFGVSVRERLQAKALVDYCPSLEEIKFQTVFTMFLMSIKIWRAISFLSVLWTMQGMQFGRKSIILGFGDKFHCETSISGSLEVQTLWPVSRLPIMCISPPVTTQTHFLDNMVCSPHRENFSSYWTSGNFECFVLYVKNLLEHISPNGEVMKALWSHSVASFTLLKSFNEKHKGKTLHPKMNGS